MAEPGISSLILTNYTCALAATTYQNVFSGTRSIVANCRAFFCVIWHGDNWR